MIINKYTAMDHYSMVQQEIRHLEIEIAVKTKHLISLHCKGETIRLMNNLDVVTTANVANAFKFDELPRSLQTKPF